MSVIGVAAEQRRDGATQRAGSAARRRDQRDSGAASANRRESGEDRCQARNDCRSGPRRADLREPRRKVTMRRRIICSSLALVLALSASQGQTSAPTVVQAVPQQNVPATAQPAAAGAASTQAALLALQAMKAANDAVLKNQASTLQRLDEIEKAADQLKIFSRRS